MTKWKKVKELQKLNTPKRKVFDCITDALIEGETLDNISKKTNIPTDRLEDIMLEGVEPQINELVLMANSVGYDLEINLIPA